MATALPDAELVKLIKVIKSLIVPIKGGLPFHQLEREYRQNEGRPLPWAAHGFPNLRSLVSSVEEIHLSSDDVLTVRSAALAHLTSLVASQKSAKPKKGRKLPARGPRLQTARTFGARSIGTSASYSSRSSGYSPAYARRPVSAATQRSVPPATQRYVPPATQGYVPQATQGYVPQATQGYVPQATQRYVSPATQRYVSPATQRYIPPAARTSPSTYSQSPKPRALPTVVYPGKKAVREDAGGNVGASNGFHGNGPRGDGLLGGRKPRGRKLTGCPPMSNSYHGNEAHGDGDHGNGARGGALTPAGRALRSRLPPPPKEEFESESDEDGFELVEVSTPVRFHDDPPIHSPTSTLRLTLSDRFADLQLRKAAAVQLPGRREDPPTQPVAGGNQAEDVAAETPVQLGDKSRMQRLAAASRPNSLATSVAPATSISDASLNQRAVIAAALASRSPLQSPQSQPQWEMRSVATLTNPSPPAREVQQAVVEPKISPLLEAASQSPVVSRPVRPMDRLKNVSNEKRERARQVLAAQLERERSLLAAEALAPAVVGVAKHELCDWERQSALLTIKPRFCDAQMIGDNLLMEVARLELNMGPHFEACGGAPYRVGLCVSGLTLTQAAVELTRQRNVCPNLIVCLGTMDILTDCELPELCQRALAVLGGITRRELRVNRALVCTLPPMPIATWKQRSTLLEFNHWLTNFCADSRVFQVWDSFKVFMDDRYQIRMEYYSAPVRIDMGSALGIVQLQPWSELGCQAFLNNLRLALG